LNWRDNALIFYNSQHIRIDRASARALAATARDMKGDAKR